jgi:N-acetylglutamate synthase-like GNAT family acetyltransferase/anti-sigma regulatory factor (Ser/Thr protein kinase)
METPCDYSKLTIPNDPEYVQIVARYVDQVAQKLGFEDSERKMIQDAAAEVVADIIRHAFEPHERSTLEVSCQRVAVGLKVTIRDWGMPFEPRMVIASATGRPSELLTGTAAEHRDLRDRVNEVEFHNLGPEGKETVLVNYLKHRSITDYYDACELEPYPLSLPTGRDRSSSCGIVVRQMQPTEAVEVARCVYKAYGYSYGQEHVYFPERLVQLNEAGEVFSVVAVTREQKVVGHAALVRHDMNCLIAEMGMAAVEPAFRGQGVLTRLTEFLVARAKAERLTGVFSQAVTNHPYSQQAGLAIGEKDCAIKLGFIPATSSFKGITERLPQRDSAVVHFMYLNRPSTVSVCLPSHHRDMVVRLYQHLGVLPEWEETYVDGERVQADRSAVRVSASVRMGLARIEVVQYGRDALQEVKTRLKELCMRHFDVIHLYLNLGDPLTCRFTEQFEELGFFFSGILPGGCPGDALILQYLNNVPIDYLKIVIKSEMGRTLLAYIRQQDPNVA